jgi:hypothetical protein
MKLELINAVEEAGYNLGYATAKYEMAAKQIRDAKSLEVRALGEMESAALAANAAMKAARR